MSVVLVGLKAFEVIQRDTSSPLASNDLGRGHIRVAKAGRWPVLDTELHYRIRLLGTAKARIILDAKQTWPARAHDLLLPVPAGGWYDLEAAVEVAGVKQGRVRFGPFGVGERFVIAGQSYAGNHHDTFLTPRDPESRFAAYDRVTDSWRIAHDPQPNWPTEQPAKSHWDKLARDILIKGHIHQGGSIWPPCMDRLTSSLSVPVGAISTTRSATLLEDWLPGKPAFAHLHETLQQGGTIRALLWQLGETDASRGTPEDVFYAQFIQLIAAVKQAGFSPTWIVAKSTSHPAAHRNTAGQGHVRKAIDRICATVPDVHVGPDTDFIGDELRQIDRHSRHLTVEGQHAMGRLWADSLHQYLSGAPAHA